MFIAHDIRNDFPEEALQLIEISEAIDNLMKEPAPFEIDENFARIKSDVALILKQILEIED